MYGCICNYFPFRQVLATRLSLLKTCLNIKKLDECHPKKFQYKQQIFRLKIYKLVALLQRKEDNWSGKQNKNQPNINFSLLLIL
jgi:hypothetical protein